MGKHLVGAVNITITEMIETLFLLISVFSRALIQWCIRACRRVAYVRHTRRLGSRLIPGWLLLGRSVLVGAGWAIRSRARSRPCGIRVRAFSTTGLHFPHRRSGVFRWQLTHCTFTAVLAIDTPLRVENRLLGTPPNASALVPSQGMTVARVARGRSGLPCDSFPLRFGVGHHPAVVLRSRLLPVPAG